VKGASQVLIAPDSPQRIYAAMAADIPGYRVAYEALA